MTPSTALERPPTTAVWHGGPPEERSRTYATAMGTRWGVRKVRPDGTVRWHGHLFRPTKDVQTLPVPGEWIVVYDFGERYEEERRRRGEPGPHMDEWTAPPDPDGCIRRMFWELVS